MSERRTLRQCVLIWCWIVCWMCEASAGASTAGSSAPLGLPPVPFPADNPSSAAEVELGRTLFFDGRLSANGAVSCAFCHRPEHGFSGGEPLSHGVNGKREGRRTPTLINRAWGKSQFWDGRAPTIEAQAIIPVTNPNEMGMTADKVVATLQGIKGYAPLFMAAFGDATINFERVTKAIANFERTIVSGNSPYDRYLAGDKEALTKSQKAGLTFYEGKGECVECHGGPNLTTEKFANIGIGMDQQHPDPGRMVVTKKRGDFGKFKIPTMREVARTGPYMHDGRFKTLGEVLDYYSEGTLPNPHLDTRIVPFFLDAETKKDLLSFLDSLSGEGWQDIHAPASMPQ